MSTVKQDELAKLMAARLNHDYVSPLTAISNGLEIYKMDASQREDAIELIQESLHNALNELQFNRVAFGSFGVDEQLPLSDLGSRIRRIFDSETFMLDMSKLTEPVLKSDAKLWFLAILCLRNTFISMTSILMDKDSRGWQITATGKGINNRDGSPRAENEWLQIAQTTPNSVQFPLLFMHADAMNYDLIFKRIDDEKMVLNFWKKPE